MKKTIIQFLFLLLPLSAFEQVKEQPFDKTPNEIRGCINITGSLNSILNARKITNGRMKIWTLEEIMLFADIKEVKNGTKTVRKITGWHLLDNQENEVEGITTIRYRKNREQRIVYTKGTEPEGCFIVEQK